jgi:hypothetical protein
MIWINLFLYTRRAFPILYNSSGMRNSNIIRMMRAPDCLTDYSDLPEFPWTVCRSWICDAYARKFRLIYGLVIVQPLHNSLILLFLCVFCFNRKPELMEKWTDRLNGMDCNRLLFDRQIHIWVTLLLQVDQRIDKLDLGPLLHFPYLPKIKNSSTRDHSVKPACTV